MSSYLDRLKAYHEKVIRSGVADGYSAATMRLSLDLEYKWRAYAGCRDRAREARSEDRMADYRDQAAKRLFRKSPAEDRRGIFRHSRGAKRSGCRRHRRAFATKRRRKITAEPTRRTFETVSKSCQYFRHFIQTVRGRADGTLALALMRQRNPSA